MAASALGSIFGGLEEFIKLRRGLQQNTEDREFLAKNRDLALRTGETELTGAGLRNSLTQNSVDRLPVTNAQQDLDFTNRLAGPEALRQALTANPNQMFGSGITAGSLLAGAQRAAARETTGDKIQNSQATIQQNAATTSGIRTDALQKVANNPGMDPVNNRVDFNTFNIAGVASGPTAGEEQGFRKTLQDDAQAAAAGLQANAQKFQTTFADRGLLPGMTPAVQRVADDSLEEFAKKVAATQQQISMIEREIAESQSRVQAARLGGNPNQSISAVGAAENYIKGRRINQNAQRAQLRAAGEELIRTLQGLGVPEQALKVYQGRVATALAGMEDIPIEDTAPNTTGGPGKVSVLK